MPMLIYFESDDHVLKIQWLPGNECLSTLEYIDCWIDIEKQIDSLNPTFILIDMSTFGYRIIPEINIVFNRISRDLDPKSIAIIKSSILLGQLTLENLLKNCPFNGLLVFESIERWDIWQRAHFSMLNQLEC
jgi:hypothetical protein